MDTVNAPTPSVTPSVPPQSGGRKWLIGLVAVLVFGVGTAAYFSRGTQLFKGSIFDAPALKRDYALFDYSFSNLTDGALTDLSQRGLHAISINFLDSQPNDIFGAVGRFAGNELLRVSDLQNMTDVGTDDFVLSGWFRPDVNAGGRQGLWGKYDVSTSSGYSVFLENGRLGLELAPAPEPPPAENPPELIFEAPVNARADQGARGDLPWMMAGGIELLGPPTEDYALINELRESRYDNGVGGGLFYRLIDLRSGREIGQDRPYSHRNAGQFRRDGLIYGAVDRIAMTADNTIIWIRMAFSAAGPNGRNRDLSQPVRRYAYVDDLSTDEVEQTEFLVGEYGPGDFKDDYFIGAYDGKYFFRERHDMPDGEEGHKLWFHDFVSGQDTVIYEFITRGTGMQSPPFLHYENYLLYTRALSERGGDATLMLYDLDSQTEIPVTFDSISHPFLAFSLGGGLYNKLFHDSLVVPLRAPVFLNFNGLSIKTSDSTRTFYTSPPGTSALGSLTLGSNAMLWRKSQEVGFNRPDQADVSLVFCASSCDQSSSVFDFSYPNFEAYRQRLIDIGYPEHMIASVFLSNVLRPLAINDEWIYWSQVDPDTGMATLWRRELPPPPPERQSVSYLTDESVIAGDTWSHIAAVFNRDGEATLYVNGRPVGSVDISSQADALSVDAPFVIGARAVRPGNLQMNQAGGVDIDVNGSPAVDFYHGLIGPMQMFRFTGADADAQSLFNAGDIAKIYSDGIFPTADGSSFTLDSNVFDKRVNDSVSFHYSVDRAAQVSVNVRIQDGDTFNVFSRAVNADTDYDASFAFKGGRCADGLCDDEIPDGVHKIVFGFEDLAGNFVALRELPLTVLTCAEGEHPLAVGTCEENLECASNRDCIRNKVCRPEAGNPARLLCQDLGRNGDLCILQDNQCEPGFACALSVCRADIDTDTVVDVVDNCPNVANPDQADINGDGIGDLCDLDSDGVPDEADNCRQAPNPDQVDIDRDGFGDACDDDLDGDGINNNADNCPADANGGQEDLDNDGAGNACDPDRDGDMIDDAADNCPNVANGGQENMDGDGDGDACDNDLDGDGFFNADDNCPLEANPDQGDIDRNGVGDACDDDRDGDGFSNDADNCPNVANPDQADLDGDSVGDMCDNDRDSDMVPDERDNCPAVLNPAQLDFDSDGAGDSCDDDRDGDGVPNDADVCADISNPDQIDFDEDGRGDACDDDMDGDLVDNDIDVCPASPDPDQVDGDFDGIGDLCDNDFDNDGVLNAADNCLGTANVDQLNTDGDDIGDVCDNDIDGDSVLNAADNCPRVANRTQDDLNSDGIGDACADDVDGDGVPNVADNCLFDVNADQSNIDGDRDGDVCDLDRDGDGVANAVDVCPNDRTNQCGAGIAGSQCLNNVACASGLCLGNVCAAQRSVPDGGACTVSLQCPLDSTCRGGVCTASSGAGPVAVPPQLPLPVQDGGGGIGQGVPAEAGTPPPPAASSGPNSGATPPNVSADRPVISAGCPAETVAAAELLRNSTNADSYKRIQSALRLMQRENGSCPEELFTLPPQDSLPVAAAPTAASKPTLDCFSLTPSFDPQKGEKSYFSCLLSSDAGRFGLTVFTPDKLELAVEENVKAGLQLKSWDGKNAAGTAIGPGTYNYIAVAENAAGQGVYRGSITVSGPASAAPSAVTANGACSDYFNDIADSDPRCSAVLFVRERNWFLGTPDLNGKALVKLDKSFSRVEFAAVVTRMMGNVTPVSNASLRFADINSSTPQWIRDTIDSAFATGAFRGDKSGNFLYNSPLERAQMWKTVRQVAPGFSAAVNYDVSPWYAELEAEMVRLGLDRGHPRSVVTRGEAIEFIYRVFTR